MSHLNSNSRFLHSGIPKLVFNWKNLLRNSIEFNYNFVASLKRNFSLQTCIWLIFYIGDVSKFWSILVLNNIFFISLSYMYHGNFHFHYLFVIRDTQVEKLALQTCSVSELNGFRFKQWQEVCLQTRYNIRTVWYTRVNTTPKLR